MVDFCETEGSSFGTSMGSSSRLGTNHVPFRSIISYEISGCIKYAQFEGIGTSCIKDTIDNFSSNTAWYSGDTNPVRRLSTRATEFV